MVARDMATWISPIEISVNWGQFIYTDFSGANHANWVLMRPYLRSPWSNSYQIWAIDFFHHAPPIHGIQNAEMQKNKTKQNKTKQKNDTWYPKRWNEKKKKKFFVTSSLLYSIEL